MSVLTIPLGWYTAVNPEGYLCHNISLHFLFTKKGWLLFATYKGGGATVAMGIGGGDSHALTLMSGQKSFVHNRARNMGDLQRECDVTLCPRLNNNFI